MKTNLILFSIFAFILLGCRKYDPQSSTEQVKLLQHIEKQVSTDGDTVRLSGIAEVAFDEGALLKEEQVTVSQTYSRITEDLFAEAQEIFLLTSSAANEIRIGTGTQLPQKPVHVVLHISDGLIAKTNDKAGLYVFAQLYMANENEVIDVFDLVRTKYSATDKTLEIDLPPDYFINTRTADKSFEAILKVGLSTLGPNYAQQKTASGECEGQYISCPVNTCQIRSEFQPARLNPYTGTVRAHKGTDLKAGVGDKVYAAADGSVYFAGVKTGYGNCVVLLHANKTFSTVYGHLSAVNVKKGDVVSEGSLLGLAGQSGGAVGPHLHFEYVLGVYNGPQSDRDNPMDHINNTSARLVSAVAACTSVNTCNGSNGQPGSPWTVSFNYKDLTQSITASSTLTFQDVEPVVNSPYTVSVGSLNTNNGVVTSPNFCATFNGVDHIRVKVYLTLPNGSQSNCIYFNLPRPAGANRSARPNSFKPVLSPI